MSTAGRPTVVVGGGLAGTTAALRLADAGRQVRLVESRPRLGGAAASFRRGDLLVDTGQHVALRCYDRYIALLRRLGTAQHLAVQPRLDIPVLLPGRPATRLRRARGLPAPAHLLPALVAYAGLGPTDWAAVARAATALRRLDADDPALDEQTLGAFLRDHGQSERVVERLWGLVTVAALNAGPDRASLGLAVRVLQTALLQQRRAGDLAVPTVPLAALHADPARRRLTGRGVEVALGERVLAVEVHDDGFVVRTTLRELVAAEVVLAVPARAAAALAPGGACPDAQAWTGLGAAPIVNAHLLLDRPVTDLPFAALPGSDAQWVFDKTAVAGAEGTGSGTTRVRQYLVTSVSDAADVLPRRAADVVADQLAALRRVLPALDRAQVLDAFVTREPRATFDQRAGTAALRPPTRTRWPGLVLSGAWTSTGWPDTMEGAVRSGEAAADALLGRHPGRPAHDLQELAS